MRIGTLDLAVPAVSHPDLLAPPVAAGLRAHLDLDRVAVAAIDPDLADTAAFCAAYEVPEQASANCVVVSGRRSGVERVAACVILATTRADVNGLVRRRLDVRGASFMTMDDAVGRTGMEYGGITPVGLPEDWRLFVDPAVLEQDLVVIGSGVRRSKLVLAGSLLGSLPGAEVVDGLARSVST